ncbi:hypothetical protein ACN20G_11240 [Streptomyces sp. BI20]|uniref:hypothetical protein n=1 Tax=Streptomyces sp. BI20 TaxID=3403460 RepID=UPI003C73DF99
MPRRLARLVPLALLALAVLLGCPGTTPRPATPAPFAAAAHATPVHPAPALAHPAGARLGPGAETPGCDPVEHTPGRPPTAPPRAGDHHVPPLPVRLPGDRCEQGPGPRPGALVRGPDRPAPSPVDLSVLRV